MIKRHRSLYNLISSAALGIALFSSGRAQSAEPVSSAPSSPIGSVSAGSVTEKGPYAVSPSEVPARVVHYTYEIVHTYPHDTSAFTEGLLIAHGNFFESTGLNGESTLREVDITSGRVLRKISIAPEYFGEGLTIVGERAFQLTWQNNQCFIYRVSDFKPIDEFYYVGEGWGLTTDGNSLIMSDGTDRIRFLDLESYKTTRVLSVTMEGKPLKSINELEYIKHEIYANIWQTDSVVRIDPSSGRVIGVVDFSGLLKPEDKAPGLDVLNGIAYDADHDRLFVTGKKWPKVFEVRLKRVND